MNLTKDWIAMSWPQRLLNLLTRPFGWDVHIERHGMATWQWGLDRPEMALAAALEEGSVALLHGRGTPITNYDLWVGPFQVLLFRE